MARIAVMFEDVADGNVDLHLSQEGLVEGAEPTPAQLMVVKLMENLKDDLTPLGAVPPLDQASLFE